MGKQFVLAFGALLIILASSPARSAESVKQIFAKCTDQKVDPETRITYCTGILEVSGLNNEVRAALYVNRAQAYEQEKDYTGANTDFEAAMAAKPDYFLPYFDRGLMREGQRDLAGALKDFDTAAKLNPEDPFPLGKSCGLRAQMNQELPKALADCNTALALKPTDTSSYSFVLGARGLTLLRMSRCSEALADFTAAIAVDPQNATSLQGRGLCRRLAGDMAGAEADFAKARISDPDVVAFLKSGGLE